MAFFLAKPQRGQVGTDSSTTALICAGCKPGSYVDFQAVYFIANPRL
jgi:hypothetical protein